MRALDNEIVRTTLRPASALYGIVSRSRNLLYDRGLVSVRRLSVPVVSIGNITLGGTGKTPLTIHIAQRLLARGVKPMILSRGYGSGGNGTRVVSEGHGPLLGVDAAGDEPVLMAARVPGACVVVDPDRVRGGRTGVRRLHPDLILLDDGFQHRRLARQLDIVMLDAVDPFGRYALLPAGRLREPFSGLARAGVFVITHAPSGENLSTLLSVLRRYNATAPIVRAEHRPECLVPAATVAPPTGAERTAPSETVPLQALRGAAVLAFSGVGNPEGFRHTLEETGARIVEHAVFRDHHRYTASEIEGIVAQGASLSVDRIVTTEKDAVRIASLPGAGAILALRIGMRIEDETPLMSAIAGVLPG